jgi:hypothetical protein
MKMPGRGAVVLTVALLTLSAAPSAQAADAADPAITVGAYRGPIDLKSGAKPGRMVLERIDVSQQEVIAHLRLYNTLPRKLLMTCPAQENDSNEVLIVSAAGADVLPTRSYCTDNAGKKHAVNVGTDLPMTVTFPTAEWQNGIFGLTWYGYTAGAMRLKSGEIVAVAPPAGSRLGDIRGTWTKIGDAVGPVGALLLVVMLIGLGVWMRRWYLRDRPEPEPKQGYSLPENLRTDEPPPEWSAPPPVRERPSRAWPTPTQTQPAQTRPAQTRPTQTRPVVPRSVPTRPGARRPEETGDNVIGFPPRGRRRPDDDRR